MLKVRKAMLSFGNYSRGVRNSVGKDRIWDVSAILLEDDVDDDVDVLVVYVVVASERKGFA